MIFIKKIGYALIVLLYGIIGIILGALFNFAALGIYEIVVKSKQNGIVLIYEQRPWLLLIVMGVFEVFFVLLGLGECVEEYKSKQ